MDTLPSQGVERSRIEPVEDVDLSDGRRLVVRHGRLEDADDLLALYRRLSDDDRRLRFFGIALPPPSFLEQWLTIADRGGVILVAFVEEDGRRPTLVAEAGYSLLGDGDGELGITVDPAWRGWIGPWLLGVLLREAAGRGVLNLQAIVQVSNRRMLSVLRHRHPAIVDCSAPDELTLVISTTGGTPGWPPCHDKPRILVEAAYGRWRGEDAARAGGFEVRTCRGPGASGECPLLAGRGCPLVAGADAVVMLLPPEAPYTGPLTAAHAASPDVVLVVPAPGSAGPSEASEPIEVVADIRRALGLDEGSPRADFE